VTAEDRIAAEVGGTAIQQVRGGRHLPIRRPRCAHLIGPPGGRVCQPAHLVCRSNMYSIIAPG
jgi:hypothetical protein